VGTQKIKIIIYEGDNPVVVEAIVDRKNNLIKIVDSVILNGFEFNNICIVEYHYTDGSSKHWRPAVVLRYNFSQETLLGRFDSLNDAFEFAKKNSNEMEIELCCSLKYIAELSILLMENKKNEKSTRFDR
jgi:hypothetical protein